MGKLSMVNLVTLLKHLINAFEVKKKKKNQGFIFTPYQRH